jgi:hypothetical protein
MYTSSLSDIRELLGNSFPLMGLCGVVLTGTAVTCAMCVCCGPAKGIDSVDTLLIFVFLLMGFQAVVVLRLPIP